MPGPASIRPSSPRSSVSAGRAVPPKRVILDGSTPRTGDETLPRRLGVFPLAEERGRFAVSKHACRRDLPIP